MNNNIETVDWRVRKIVASYNSFTNKGGQEDINTRKRKWKSLEKIQ